MSTIGKLAIAWVGLGTLGLAYVRLRPRPDGRELAPMKAGQAVGFVVAWPLLVLLSPLAP